jgi:hypothetical protein
MSIISRQFCGKVWNLDEVMEYFSNELRAQENCSLSMVNKSEPFRKRDNNCTASGLLSHNSNPS